LLHSHWLLISSVGANITNVIHITVRVLSIGHGWDGIGRHLGRSMKPFSARASICASVVSAPLFAVFLALVAAATAAAAPLPPAAKMNAYVECVNRLSERAYDSRKRYFSWAAQSGPTGHERIIYGTYTIYDTSGCRKNVGIANAMEPHDAALEAALCRRGEQP
jgi:hypothetical protein